MMAAIFNHLWQSTVFAVAVAVLSLAFRRNRARLRYGLWFIASVKFLVPFALLAAAGTVLEWKQPPAPIASVMAAPLIRGFNTPFAQIPVDAAAAVTTTPSRDWIGLSLVLAWLCGFVGIAIRRAKEWRRIRAAVRASTPWDATTPERCRIPIRTASTVLEPAVVGFWKPVILLPRGIDTFLTARQLEAVLAHEICHVRRRDNLTAAVHMVVEALFWFHPMAWWIGARLVAAREQACDEHVVGETAEPLAYAEGIVTICRRYVEAPLMSVPGVGGADIKARIESILANRIGLRLTLAKRILLAAVAVVSLAVPILTGAISAAQLPGLPPVGPPIDPEMRFEVASIKPFDASGGAAPRFTISPGRYDFGGMPLRLFVGTALRGVPLDRILGLPDWIDRERYTIVAKAPDGPAPLQAMAVMMANLLKDRFRMTTHTETREMAVYNLVFARADKRFGPGLKETSAECRAKLAAAAQQGGAMPPSVVAECVKVNLNPGIVRFSAVQIPLMVNYLTQSVGRPVIDKTGLTSFYDVTLKWTPEPGSIQPAPFGLPPGAVPGANPLPSPEDPDAPNLFTAVQEQLGLKLESGRGPVEVVVIDHMEKPTFD
jgi:bla regulator protein blaR1